MQRLLNHVEEILKTSILSTEALSGGDIAAVTKINTSGNTYVLKTHNEESLDLLRTECNGLKLIRETNTIATPHTFAVGCTSGQSFLIMEYIPTKSPTESDFTKLGSQLALLHNCYGKYFGLNHDNYIGRLTQKNNQIEDWIDFYSKQRLLFQLNMAMNKKLLLPYEIPTFQDINEVLEAFCFNVQPSLLHGDLWSGNFLIHEDGTPYLIDPAVYHGDSEIDIAMSTLFGGFGHSFYEAYFHHSPKSTHFKERVELYQLYYLLVHLNMFGSSYQSGVRRILRSFF